MINSKDAKRVEDGNLQLGSEEKMIPSSFKILNGNHVNRDIINFKEIHFS